MELCFDKDGQPLNTLEWGNMFKDWDYRNIAQSVDTSRNSVTSISTVWLGVKHGEDTQGRPLIFETRVDKDGEELGMIRYATAQDAIDGHRATCKQWGIPFDAEPPKKLFQDLKFEKAARWKGIVEDE